MGTSAEASWPLAAAPVSTAEGEAMIRIVAVDDDEYFREMLTNELVEQGFLVDTFPDAQAMLNALDIVADADVIVLDWSLPRTSGIDLLPQIRRLGINIPVIFLTGRALIANESLAFDRGAFDFVDKSRGMAVLTHRLRLVARAKVPEKQRERSVQCGRLVLKPHISRAYWDGVDVDLTLGEFKIVQLLTERVGQHVSYREIYDCLHYRGFIAGSGDNGYRTNVRSAIKRVRSKFHACDPTFAEIENYTAYGYVWGRVRGASDE